MRTEGQLRGFDIEWRQSAKFWRITPLLEDYAGRIIPVYCDLVADSTTALGEQEGVILGRLIADGIEGMLPW